MKTEKISQLEFGPNIVKWAVIALKPNNHNVDELRLIQWKITESPSAQSSQQYTNTSF